MEGRLFKNSKGVWHIMAGAAGFGISEYEIHPDYVKAYLLQDEDEGQWVNFQLITRSVYNNIEHKSIDLPAYAYFPNTLKKFRDLKEDNKTKKEPMWTQTTTNDQIKEDSIVEAIRTQLKDRSDVGIRKYGMTLDRTDFNILNWLEELKQELMDATLYLERLKREIKEKGLDG